MYKRNDEGYIYSDEGYVYTEYNLRSYFNQLIYILSFNFSQFSRVVSFAFGAVITGCVVFFAERAFQSGITASQFVTGRLFWGSLILLIICRIFFKQQLYRSYREHFRFAFIGFFGIWLAISLFTYALKNGSATPVVCLVAGTAAIVGMLDEYGRRITTGHMFVLISNIGVLSALVVAAKDMGSIGVEGVLSAVASGVIFGYYPRLVGGKNSLGFDLGAVAIYLGYGFIASLIHCSLTKDACIMIISPDDITFGVLVFVRFNYIIEFYTIASGVVCSGLAYALYQYGLSADSNGRNIGKALPALLFAFEPLAAIIVAVAFLGDQLTVTLIVLISTFLMLSLLSGQTLRAVSLRI